LTISAVPRVPDHELIRRIGRGSYGEVWLGRNVLGTYRAVKVAYREDFNEAKPYEREYHGIQRFEPVSRSHEGLINILQVGRNEVEGYFYYVMELADDAGNADGQRPARSDADPFGYSPMTLSQRKNAAGRLPVRDLRSVGSSPRKRAGQTARTRFDPPRHQAVQYHFRGRRAQIG
jgi:eukaryotic-like serine/threonine-protein kinase